MPLTRAILLELTAGRMTQAQLAAALAARGVMVLHLRRTLRGMEGAGLVCCVILGREPLEWRITLKGELELSREAVQVK